MLAAQRPALRLSAGGERIDLTFSALDDFHPDRICDNADALSGIGEEEQTELLRAILHHRDFQALEAAWRGLEWLLRGARGRGGGSPIQPDARTSWPPT